MSRRAPLVVGATAVGVAAVLSFHTRPAVLNLKAVAAGSPGGSPSTSTGATNAPPPSGGSSSSATSGSVASSASSASSTLAPAANTAPKAPATTTTNAPATTTSRPVTTTAPSTTTTRPSPTTTAPRATTRSATGPLVDYNYGVLSVRVTASGTKIRNIQIASLQDDGSFRSVSIDQQSLPLLQQEAMAAQSANIQSISGASYTSAGFIQSLQGALSSLGLS